MALLSLPMMMAGLSPWPVTSPAITQTSPTAAERRHTSLHQRHLALRAHSDSRIQSADVEEARGRQETPLQHAGRHAFRDCHGRLQCTGDLVRRDLEQHGVELVERSWVK